MKMYIIACFKCGGKLSEELEYHGHKGGDYYRSCLLCKSEYRDYEYSKYYDLQTDAAKTTAYNFERLFFLMKKIEDQEVKIKYAESELLKLKQELIKLKVDIK